MAYQATVYNVMIASPSDVSEERKVIREVIHKWNTVHSENQKIVLLPIDWRTHSTPETGGRPQGILNRQILERSDLLIGLFWTRLGTPTDQYVSGSAEEISRHVNAGKPAMLYFSDRPIEPSAVDREQYERLQQYKNQWNAHALIEEWDSPSDLREKFDSQLQITLTQNAYFQNTAVSEIQPSRSISQPALSDLAKRLLIVTLDGDGYIRHASFLRTEEINAGGKTLATRNKFRCLLRCKEAIEELEKKELIEAPEPVLLGAEGSTKIYGVTQEGIRVYDELSESIRH